MQASECQAWSPNCRQAANKHGFHIWQTRPTNSEQGELNEGAMCLGIHCLATQRWPPLAATAFLHSALCTGLYAGELTALPFILLLNHHSLPLTQHCLTMEMSSCWLGIVLLRSLHRLHFCSSHAYSHAKKCDGQLCPRTLHFPSRQKNRILR